VARDRAADLALAAAGWQVVRVWEHESLEGAVAAVVAALAASAELRPAIYGADNGGADHD
jgi:DNA mismatch endonuclease (patch repair protein)